MTNWKSIAVLGLLLTAEMTLANEGTVDCVGVSTAFEEPYIAVQRCMEKAQAEADNICSSSGFGQAVLVAKPVYCTGENHSNYYQETCQFSYSCQ